MLIIGKRDHPLSGMRLNTTTSPLIIRIKLIIIMADFAFTFTNTSADRQDWSLSAIVGNFKLDAGDDFTAQVNIAVDATIDVTVTRGQNQAAGRFTYVAATQTWTFASNSTSFTFAFNAFNRTVSLSCSV